METQIGPLPLHARYGKALKSKDEEPPCHIEPVNCVGKYGFQSVCRAAAASVHAVTPVRLHGGLNP